MGKESDSSDWFGVDIENLSARLRFNPDDAHIWLESERMVLLHVSAFAHLRSELIEEVGRDRARAILAGMGATSGTLDAAIARRAMPHAGPVEAFNAGPRLHAIEGMVVPDEVTLEVDPDSGLHVGEWIWRNSAEADAHLQSFGVSAEPACWMQTGYASAYASAFMGRPIVYKEVECRAMGAAHCRIVGRPAEMWEEDAERGAQLAIDLTQPTSENELADTILPDDAELARHPDNLMVGASAAFGTVMRLTERLARSEAPMMIIGAPGTGKKSAALAAHNMSARARNRVESINCAGYDEDELETEIFGRAKTRDEAGRQGLVEKAAGGTLILEDVKALPSRCQAKLLDILTSGQFRRRGDATQRYANVRVIVCANEGLREATKAGAFREDLYFRLSVGPIFIPSLRDRRADLPVLIRHFLSIFVSRYGKRLRGMSMEAVGYLLTHDFRGNVAELSTMIERAVLMAQDGEAIEVVHLQSPADLNQPSYFKVSPEGHLVAARGPGEADMLSDRIETMLRNGFDLEEFEQQIIQKAVARSGGNLAKAAKVLGLTRPQLAYRYKKMEG